MVIKQFPELNEKWKALTMRGFRKMDHIIDNIETIDCLNKGSHLNKSIQAKLRSIKGNVDYRLSPIDHQKNLLTVNFKGDFDEDFKSIVLAVGEEDNSIYTVRYLNNSNK